MLLAISFPRVRGFGSWIRLLGSGFEAFGVDLLGFLGLGSLYKHRKLTLGKNFGCACDFQIECSLTLSVVVVVIHKQRDKQRDKQGDKQRRLLNSLCLASIS